MSGLSFTRAKASSPFGASVLPALFFLLFFCLYMSLSLPSVLWPDDNRYGFHLIDRYFEADPVFTIKDLTTSNTSMRGPHRHPFITLFTHPIGSRVSAMLYRYEPLRLDSRLRWQYQTIITLAITNAFLSAALSLVFLCIWKLSRDAFTAILFTSFVGVSNSALVFSIIPEHFSASFFFLCLAYLTFFHCIKESRVWVPAWVALSVICFSITSFNILQPGLLFALVLYNQRTHISHGKLFRHFVSYTTMFLLVCTILLALRTHYQPEERPFTYETARKDIFVNNAGFAGIRDPANFVSTMLRQAVVAPVVSPIPRHDIFKYPKEQEPFKSLWYFTYADWSFYPLGWVSVLVLTALCAHRLLSHRRGKRAIPGILSVGMLGCLCINFLFHSLYGWGPEMIHRGRIDIFLYSLHWLFPLCYFLFPLNIARKVPVLMLLGFLSVTIALNNLSVLKGMYEVALGYSVDSFREEAQILEE